MLLPAVAGAASAPDPTGLDPIVGRFLRQGETSILAPILSGNQGYHPPPSGRRTDVPAHRSRNPPMTLRAGSLVLYKNRPARVVGVTDKIDIDLGEGKTKRVRDKDVVALHPGPVQSRPEIGRRNTAFNVERWQREGHHARKEKTEDRQDTPEARRRYLEGEFSDFIEH